MSSAVVILGATGSIGRSALDVIRSLGDDFRIAAVTADSSWDKLAEIARSCNAALAVIRDQQYEASLKQKLSDTDIEVRSGDEALQYAAAMPEADIVITGIVGGIGLQSTLAAIKAGKRVGVANKESFVMAGRLLSRMAEQHNAEIVPVDSEHSAVFQCLQGEEHAAVRKIYITGSGGSLREVPVSDFPQVTPDAALNHPTWNMGPKITVDSATMMNKALELIEARWLFKVLPQQLEVIVHPQSIIHSMVLFADGNLKAQLGFPDMRLPIQYAITYPRRIASDRELLDLTEIGSLTFEKPDLEKFPAVAMGYELLHAKGDAGGVILNAANEEAVNLFLSGKMTFTGIAAAAASALQQFQCDDELSIEEIFTLDAEVRAYITKDLA